MNPFANITTMANDAVILVSTIIALAVTILGFRLGRAWTIKITTDAEYEEFKEKEVDMEYHDMVQDDLF